MQARFVTFEGIDGAGKSTAVRALAGLLDERGIDHILTREPGGTAVGESIRGILLDRRSEISPETELLLIFAARQEHVLRVVRPALERGAWVLCDRFADASYAYQGGGRGIALDRIDTLRDWVLGTLRPDATFLVDAPVELASERLGRRGDAPDRFEVEAQAFHERVRATYLALQTREPERIHRLPAQWTPDAIQAHLSEWLTSVCGGAA